MFWFFIRIRAFQRLGFGKLFQYISLILLVGCVIAGLIYAAVIIHAVNERNHPPYVHAHSSQ